MSMVSAKLQEVYDATKGRYERLFSLLAGLNDAQAQFKPSVNDWSVGEIAHHIALIQTNILRSFEKLLARAEAANLGPDLDTSSALRSMGAFADKSREKFQSPAIGLPQYGRPLTDSIRELEAQRQQLESLLPRLSLRDLKQIKFNHPAFGDLDLYQWVLLLGGHAARHQKQMKSIMEHPEYPNDG